MSTEVEKLTKQLLKLTEAAIKSAMIAKEDAELVKDCQEKLEKAKWDEWQSNMESKKADIIKVSFDEAKKSGFYNCSYKHCNVRKPFNETLNGKLICQECIKKEEDDISYAISKATWASQRAADDIERIKYIAEEDFEKAVLNDARENGHICLGKCGILNLPFYKKPKGKWMCRNCRIKNIKNNNVL